MPFRACRRVSADFPILVAKIFLRFAIGYKWDCLRAASLTGILLLDNRSLTREIHFQSLCQVRTPETRQPMQHHCTVFCYVDS